MKKTMFALLLGTSLTLVACESHSNVLGKLTYKSSDFVGTEELGEFNITEDKTEVSFPFEVKKIKGDSEVTLTIKFETSDVDGEVERSIEVFSKKVADGEKGEVSFVAEKAGEYEVFLHSDKKVETEFITDLRKLGGELDGH